VKRKITSLLIFIVAMAHAQKEIPLYKGTAPGSENWTWAEGINNNNSLKVMTVYNVVSPALTVFAPDPKLANGTAIIIAPGGGFHFLAIDHEGNDAAKQLVKKGITVFVLKYRLVHVLSNNPFDDMLNAEDKKAWDDESLPIIPLAIEDGRQAIAYVRTHATEYKIDTNKIGIMGFSAGGMVAAATAFNYTANNRPDFVAPIYGDMPESIQSTVLPDAPPLFLACAQDDEFNFAPHAIRMYNKWYAAKRPVEMHLFTTGGHGFGTGNPNNTTYNWIDKFVDWMRTEGLVKKQ
jgi:acetyl esterase/lipase